tara:strand:- start:612 stop:1139 length:528 start_codon:yes stop_codon:yes gene_type:complete
MNIFYLHPNAQVCAEMHCDAHVVKMLLEYAQLLSTAHRELDGDKYADDTGLYKATHKNHPSAVWVRKSRSNYRWVHSLLLGVCEQYTQRYGRVHKTQSSGVVEALSRCPIHLSIGYFTAPPLCMPDEYKAVDVVDAYRDYYIGEKLYKKDGKPMAKWSYSERPKWANSNHEGSGI